MPRPMDAAYEAEMAERALSSRVADAYHKATAPDATMDSQAHFDYLSAQLRAIQAKNAQRSNNSSSNASIRSLDFSESWTPGLTDADSVRESGIATPVDRLYFPGSTYFPRNSGKPIKPLNIDLVTRESHSSTPSLLGDEARSYAPRAPAFHQSRSSSSTPSILGDEARSYTPRAPAEIRLDHRRSSTSTTASTAELDYAQFPTNQARTREPSVVRQEIIAPPRAQSPLASPAAHHHLLSSPLASPSGYFHDTHSPRNLEAPSLFPPTIKPVEESKPTSETSSEEEKLSVEVATKEKAKPGLWGRFYNEYRKNYCPTEQPELILPTAPTDKEKTSFVYAGRIFLIACDVLSTGALGVGAWFFIKADWVFVWYALYAAYSELFTLTSLIITIFGSSFDYKAHQKVIEDFPITDETAPTVDVFLPVCKEPLEILENTWNHISAMDYPSHKIKYHVLDDGQQAEVKELAARFDFNYIIRPNRGELKKAGNLRYGFSQTEGDFFTIFDADFCPRTDFLSELIPVMMHDGKVAIVQSPQYFRSTGNQTWIEQGAGATQEYFYRMVQTCRNRWGGSICVGSNAVYRREALAEVGGTAPVEHSEDMETGFFAITRGWTVQYRPLVLACGVCPDSPRAFFVQQMRWCNGSLHMLTRSDFWASNLSVMQKFCYATGVLCYYASATSAIFTPLPAIVILWARPDMMKFYNLFFAFPAVIIGLIGMRIWARARYTMSVQYVQAIMGYAHMQAVWDQIFGTTLQWVPSGDTGLAKKAKKADRYGNMRIAAWAWTIALNTLLITGVTYRVLGGLHWYECVPALALDAYNLLIMHRFLLYRHAKE